MNLQTFNFFLLFFAPHIMRKLTNRNHTMICALFMAVILEYISILGDTGMMYEFGVIIFVYADIKGMIIDFYKNIKSAITVA